MSDQTFYRTPKGETFRVTIEQDPDASSPRENDNATVIHTFDRGWISPDDGKHGRGIDAHPSSPLIPRDYIYDGRVDMRRARRWVNLFGKDPDVGILAIAGVERIQGGWAEGGLRITPVDDSRTPDRAVGYVAITAQSWADCMGDSPLQGDPTGDDEHGTPDAEQVMAQDVAEYSRWAAGEFVGYTVERAVTWAQIDTIDDLGDYDHDVTMTTWEQIEDGACWGIDLGDDEQQRKYGNYALDAAKEHLPADAVEITAQDAGES